jgi:pimeloyl-ACP methyl ester carboxylesterase
MRSLPAKMARAVLVTAALGAATVACTSNPPPPPPAGAPVPVIFVHGVMGSSSQYRSQAQRWASNGFPAERVQAFHYNTQTVDSSGLNAFVDNVRRQFGVSQVNLVGHSLGTFMVNSYVSANRAKVARFVLVDGAACPTGNSACLAIRAASMGQTHVESSVSAESFARQYQFFTGRAPATTTITPEAGTSRIELAGTALDNGTNAPSAAGAAGQVWAVDPATGARVGATPAATFTVGADGRWGPVAAERGRPYELTLGRGDGITAHFYYQPFVRSSYLVNLTTATPSSPSSVNTNRGPGHAALVVERQREWWRSHGAANDTLTVTAPGQPAREVLSRVTGDVIGIHLHDDRATPGVSSLALLPYFSTQPFQTGVDVYMPATNPPTGTISLVNAPRGNTAKLQRVNVPALPSSTDAIQIEFEDWVA